MTVPRAGKSQAVHRIMNPLRTKSRDVTSMAGMAAD
jgi:hypothetical protein